MDSKVCAFIHESTSPNRKLNLKALVRRSGPQSNRNGIIQKVKRFCLRLPNRKMLWTNTKNFLSVVFFWSLRHHFLRRKWCNLSTRISHFNVITCLVWYIIPNVFHLNTTKWFMSMFAHFIWFRCFYHRQQQQQRIIKKFQKRCKHLFKQCGKFWKRVIKHE